MTGYCYDKDTGIYLWETDTIQELPTNSGTYLLPTNVTLVPPPEIPAGSFARWNGSGWGIETLPPTPSSTPVPLPTPTPTPLPVPVPETITWETVRTDRDNRLGLSDWTQLPDSNVNKEVWATYRQALRDVPQNNSDPENINWPTKPQ